MRTRQRRLIYSFGAAAAMIAGLASRQFRMHLPEFVAEYAGDTLWALMLFLVMTCN